MWHEMGWSGLWSMWYILVIGVIMVVYAVTRLTAGSQIRRQIPKAHERALDVVKRRYANGEINREHFERMKKALQ